MAGNPAPTDLPVVPLVSSPMAGPALALAKDLPDLRARLLPRWRTGDGLRAPALSRTSCSARPCRRRPWPDWHLGRRSAPCRSDARTGPPSRFQPGPSCRRPDLKAALWRAIRMAAFSRVHRCRPGGSCAGLWCHRA